MRLLRRNKRQVNDITHTFLIMQRAGKQVFWKAESHEPRARSRELIDCRQAPLRTKQLMTRRGGSESDAGPVPVPVPALRRKRKSGQAR